MQTMKYIEILIIFMVIFSCSATKQNSTKKTSLGSKPIVYKFDLSLKTKMFLKELEEEKEDKTNYIPSNKLIDKYNIKKLNDIYTISGFIKINDEYNENVLTQLNIKTNSNVGNIITVIVPLNSIDAFLTLDGINYFEISTQVDLKNN